MPEILESLVDFKDCNSGSLHGSAAAGIVVWARRCLRSVAVTVIPYYTAMAVTVIRWYHRAAAITVIK